MLILLALLGGDPTGENAPPAAAAEGELPRQTSQTPADAEQAIWMIELHRMPPETLDGYLADPDPQVRARATLALGRLRDPQAVGRLQNLGGDEAVAVREAAAFGLGLIPEGVQSLVALLLREDAPSVRGRLYAALGQHGGADHVPLLLEGLARPKGEAEAAATAIGRLGMRKVEGVSSAEVIDGLRGLLQRRLEPQTRQAAAFALARMGPPALTDEQRADLLHRQSHDHDPVVRAWLLKAITPSMPDDSTRLQVLREASRDADTGVRIAAARALPSLGAGATDVASALLRDRARAVRLEAIRATGSTKGLDHSTLLTPFLEDKDPVAIGAAITGLTAAGVELPLRTYLREGQPMQVRVAAIGALSDLPQLLRLALRSPDTVERSAAATRLDELNPDYDTSLALLGASDEKIAAMGATQLAKRADPRSLKPLVEVVTGAKDADLLAEGLAAINAVLPKSREGALYRAQVQLLAEAALTSPEASVRRAGRALSSTLGVPASLAPVHGLPVLPTLADAQRIVSARVITDSGELRIRLRPDIAPYAVWNFATLAEANFYDGIIFHRVVPDFVIQAGCPRGDGWGGPGYSIPDELSWAHYGEGAVGMAISGPDTGGSQWFITLAPQPHLDGGYTLFGQLDIGKGTAQAIEPGAKILDVVIERVP